MASMTTAAASLLPSTTTNLTKNAIPFPSGRRSGLVVVAKASAGEEKPPNLGMKRKEAESNGRRELMFVGAAIAACSIAKAAMADEPKAGTPQAKKKYAPICVTMPTAKICHK
ncbi:hypothetical protein LWI28_002468 [Acer negundo]|uniref:Photosystem II 5 kDa protein, chloroplastic n=1 Tax=Acer negundo TaxID=4023 RepID=A0AAD5P0T8_ACENE|nr:hypothetical protein LWI28_002468 [Acer negundo]KAK4857384.1 hypothetical protein QYF36_027430 [Acer negundo]